jgi:hypothetical protein
MVNASWTARPPDPRCPLASFGSIPPDAANPNPVGTPRRGFWYLANFRHGTRLVSPKFSGRGIGARQPGCRALRHRMPRRDSARAAGALFAAPPTRQRSCAPDSGRAEHHSHSPTRSLGLRLACASELSGPCKQVTVKSVVAVYSHYSAASMVDLAPLRRGFFMRVLPRAVQPNASRPR